MNLPMSRPLRIEYPDAWYHIMNRGGRIKENNRKELVGDLTPYYIGSREEVKHDRSVDGC